MSWDNLATQSQVTVTLIRDGQETAKTFNGDVTVESAVRQLANEFGLTSATVKNASGEELTPAEGNKTLGEVGNVSMYPKAVGA